MSKRILAQLTMGAMLCISQHAYSSAFFINEQSASNLGYAFGGAALAEDASVIFFNPAGISKLGQEVVACGNGIFPFAKFHNNNSIATLPPTVPPQLLRGGNGHDCGVKAFVGSLYYTRPLPCNFTFGLGVNAPFGLVTNYGDDWVGRYYASYSKLLTININPCLAYRFNDCFSIAVGFEAMWAKADLRNAIDFGSILFAATGGQLGIPQGQDGKGKVSGDSWGYGATAGLLWDVTSCTRIGFAYRSEIKQHIKGHIHFKDVPAPLQSQFITGRSAKANLTLPMTLSLHASHHFNHCITVVGDITWTKWDSIKRLRIRSSGLPDLQGNETIVTLRWNNTVRYSLGANYRLNCRWLFRAGIAYDESPVPNKKYATPRIPDNDRFWIAFGGRFDWTRCLHFDVGYAHLFTKNPKINKIPTLSPGSETFFQGGLRGHWKAHADIITGQVVWDF